MEENKVLGFLNDNFGMVRVVTKEDELWFCASDICNILEIKNVSSAVNGNPTRKDKGIGDKNKVVYNVKTNGGNQDLLFMNKIGLHYIISKARRISIEKKINVYKWLTEKGYDESITDYCNESEFNFMLDNYIDIFKKQAATSNIDCIDCRFGDVKYFELFNYSKQYNVLNYFIDFFFPNSYLIVEYDEGHHIYQGDKDNERMNDIIFDLLKNEDNKVEYIDDEGVVTYISKKEFDFNIHNNLYEIIRVKKGEEIEGIIKIIAHITSFYHF